MKKYFLILMFLLIIGVAFFAFNKKEAELKNVEITKEESKEGETMSYKQINMEEAKVIFKEKGDYIILDVRRQDEYVNGHIKDAINIANEDILSADLKELPDKNQTIYVYCRSGRRSKEAAEKLVSLGYTNIVEFGGIIDWTGETEK